MTTDLGPEAAAALADAAALAFPAASQPASLTAPTADDIRQAIDEARELAASLPPRRTMHCNPSVTAALMAASPPREPAPLDFMSLGQIGNLCGIEVYEDDEMMPGAWEIREGAAIGKGGKMEGGKVVSFGVLRGAND